MGTPLDANMALSEVVALVGAICAKIHGLAAADPVHHEANRQHVQSPSADGFAATVRTFINAVTPARADDPVVYDMIVWRTIVAAAKVCAKPAAAPDYLHAWERQQDGAIVYLGRWTRTAAQWRHDGGASTPVVDGFDDSGKWGAVVLGHHHTLIVPGSNFC